MTLDGFETNGNPGAAKKRPPKAALHIGLLWRRKNKKSEPISELGFVRFGGDYGFRTMYVFAKKSAFS